MTRKFDIGHQNEILFNEEHFNIYKILQHYYDFPFDKDKGPIASNSQEDPIYNKALWLDSYTNPNSADLKYYSNGIWKLLFGDRFKLLQYLLSEDEPEDPIDSQLWINPSGILCYYYNGTWNPIKAQLADLEDDRLLDYEDFLIINPLEGAENTVYNNFSKFVFTNTPILNWEANKQYYYQQGVMFEDELYVCLKEHFSSNELNPSNKTYWIRLELLIQYLLPNTYTDKIFIDGWYLHERISQLEDIIGDKDIKLLAITFEGEDDSVLHDSLRFDVEGDDGNYFLATAAVYNEEDGKYYTYSLDAAGNIQSTEATETQLVDATLDNFTNDGPSEPVILPDDEERGYIINTNVSAYIPEDLVDDGETVTGVHVNPRRLNKIYKYFIEMPEDHIISVPKEDTEYYGIDENGFGFLLLEKTDDKSYDYYPYYVNGKECIKIQDDTSTKYKYIYAIHYDFLTSFKKKGVLYKDKVPLNSSNSIYIGPTNAKKLAVFAQGLWYESTKSTWQYNYADKYIYFYEDLAPNGDRLDMSVLTFPYVYNGSVTKETYKELNYKTGRGYRVDINSIPYNIQHTLAFISGVQLNPMIFNSSDFNYYPDDPTCIYFPTLTKEYVEANDIVYFSIIETDNVINGICYNSMYRGTYNAEILDNGHIGLRITRNEDEGGNLPYLDYLESPICFVDGLLIFQKDITIEEDYIMINNLQLGQEIVFLADGHDNLNIDEIITSSTVITQSNETDPALALEDSDTNLKMITDSYSIDVTGASIPIMTDYVFEDGTYTYNTYNFDLLTSTLSDSILFEDNTAYVNIPCEHNDSTIVYLRDGLICDTEAVYKQEFPDNPINGQIIKIINSSEENWYKYNANTLTWDKIEDNTIIDELKANALEYFLNDKSFSIIKETDGQKYCTYYGYKYADTIEHKLQAGVIYPNGINGVNKDYSAFNLNLRHYYEAGRNELTVYLNGVMQRLTAPTEDGFNNSLSRECNFYENNNFVLAINDGTKVGKAINPYDGFFTYETTKNGLTKYEYFNSELTAEAIAEYDSCKLISSPGRNIIFYIVEKCEDDEALACNRTVLNYKNSLGSVGAYSNNIFHSNEMNLTRGNIRVYINGIRQPNGVFKDKDGENRQSYKILNSSTIQFTNDIIGGTNNNFGTSTDPKFELSDGVYFTEIDEIVVETRTDYTLREVTIPIKPGQFEFEAGNDDLPNELFNSKDFIMIYINGLAYGNDYKNENGVITLTAPNIANLLKADNNVITFEWR